MLAVSRLILGALLLLVAGSRADVDYTKQCYITSNNADKPESLTFCHKFNDKACCPPAMDAEVNEMFSALTDLGLSCRIRGNVRTTVMAKLYCMTCDPEQPSYVRMEPHVPQLSGAETAPWKLGDLCAPASSTCNYDFTAFPDKVPVPMEKRDKTILVCKDWVDKRLGNTVTDRSLFLSDFDRCGLKKSSPCTDSSGKIIPGRDRYTCGDDLILPSKTYASAEEFLNIESMGPPQLDENFGFKIVENRPCSNAELTSASANGALLEPGNDHHLAAQYNRFNPNCLRTKAQIQTFGVSPYSAWSGGIPADVSDEKCFAAAAWARPLSLLALLVLALMALVIIV